MFILFKHPLKTVTSNPKNTLTNSYTLNRYIRVFLTLCSFLNSRISILDPYSQPYPYIRPKSGHYKSLTHHPYPDSSSNRIPKNFPKPNTVFIPSKTSIFQQWRPIHRLQPHLPTLTRRRCDTFALRSSKSKQEASSTRMGSL